jgi:hypothetical protein
MSGLEILGAVAGALQLAGVLKQILTLISWPHGTMEEFQAQAAQTQGLIDIVTEIHRKPEFQTPEINAAVNRCLEEAQSILATLNAQISDDRMKKATKSWKVLRGLMRNTIVKEAFALLERQKSTISLCIQSINR